MKLTPDILRTKFHKCSGSLDRSAKYSLERSPVAPLLRTNDPPSDLERRTAEEILCQRQAELEKLETSLSKNPYKTDLLKHKKLCSEYIQAHQSILSPYRLIPLELLEMIFLHYWATTAPAPSEYADWKHLPWNISQVCRTWRAAALSLPTLWSHLPGIKPSKRVAKTKLEVQLLHALLDRSRDAPLTLYVRAPEKKFTSHPVIDLLVQHAERWEQVTIESSYVTMAAFGGVAGRLANLHTLYLQLWRIEVRVNLETFAHAPKLRHVCVDGFYPAYIALPWSQLLSYKEGVVTEAVEIDLEHATALETLEIVRLVTIHAWPFHATLPNVKTLTLEVGKTTPGAGLIENFTLPALEEVTMRFSQTDVVGGLFNLIQRSRPHSPCLLRKIHLRTDSFSTLVASLSDLLSLTPLLEELECDIPPDLGAGGAQPLQGISSVSQGSTPLAPRLRVLIFHIFIFREIDLQAFHDIAKSRCTLASTSDSDDCTSSEASNSSPNDGHGLFPGEVVPLSTFRLSFLAESESHKAQVALNEIHQGRSREVDEPTILDLLAMTLVEELPGLNHGRPPKKRDFDLTVPRRLNQLFRALEEVSADDADLQMSRIPRLLHRLATMNPDDIPGDRKYLFRNRAEALLQRWHPTLWEAARHHQWVQKGRRSVEYCPSFLPDPENNDSHSSALIYGIQEDPEDIEPHHRSLLHGMIYQNMSAQNLL